MTYKTYSQFLVQDKVDEINALADTIVELDKDNRSGGPYQSVRLANGGYDALRNTYNHGSKPLASLIEKCLDHIPEKIITWTANIIQCKPGGFIHPHQDSPHVGHEWWRFNVRLSPPSAGGVFMWEDKDPVHLEMGDAMMFRADTNLHSVGPCTALRRILSIGCVVK